MGNKHQKYLMVHFFLYTFEKVEIFLLFKKTDLLAAIPQINVKNK